MPSVRCPNGKWRSGSGPCIYKTKAAADAAGRATHARRAKKRKK